MLRNMKYKLRVLLSQKIDRFILSPDLRRFNVLDSQAPCYNEIVGNIDEIIGNRIMLNVNN